MHHGHHEIVPSITTAPRPRPNQVIHMNEPGTRSETETGQDAGASGQDQDKQKAAQTIDEAIAADLKLIISTGKNLNLDHCAKLTGIRHLVHVRQYIRTKCPTDKHQSLSHDPSLTPYEVRSFVRESLNHYIITAVGSVEREQANVLMRLFGLTPATQELESKGRRRVARAYYSEHANFGKRVTTPENFIRRICPEELLRPFIALLVNWNNELEQDLDEDGYRPRWSRELLVDDWDHHFSWQFAVLGMLSEATRGIRDYFSHLHKGDSDRARNLAYYSLTFICGLWRLARMRDSIQSTYRDASTSGVTNIHLFDQFFADFTQAFSFSAPDEKCLDDAIDKFVIFDTRSEESDNNIRLAFKRYLVLFEPCDCPKNLYGVYERLHGSAFSEPAMQATYPEAVFETYKIDGIVGSFLPHLIDSHHRSEPNVLSMMCPVHMLLSWHHILHEAIKDEWLSLGMILARVPVQNVLENGRRREH